MAGQWNPRRPSRSTLIVVCQIIELTALRRQFDHDAALSIADHDDGGGIEDLALALEPREKRGLVSGALGAHAPSKGRRMLSMLIDGGWPVLG